MITLPHLSGLDQGVVVDVAGVPYRHVGGGRFSPAVLGEPMLKRFDTNVDDALHYRRMADV
jgi:hypothetical protein